ncbi:MAG: 4-(cytidine 5'-diphospho)-2-C-methyl-D-erythritol kinase, partial [Acidobacteriota bacterium]
MPSAFSLPSFAKINLQLRILGKRGDSFHELFTVFQTVSLQDTLHFGKSDRLALTCDDPTVPIDERNLIIKAATLLRAQFGVSQGAAIHLEKRIPSPGGLGGGSSNAAIAMIGLTRLWDVSARNDDMQALATDLGSDVPFFLHGGTAVGICRGEVLEPIADVDEQFVLIVTPDIRVSTKDAFERLSAATLTKEASNRILRVCRDEAKSLDLRHSVLINDFEASVFDAHPEIRRVKEALVGLGAVNAAMSGSGASVFAIFDKTETRQAAIKAL